MDWALAVALVWLEDNDNFLFVPCRFQHKNPEDATEVPGGFVTDCNKVGTVSEAPVCATGSVCGCHVRWVFGRHCQSVLSVCMYVSYVCVFFESVCVSIYP